MTDRPYVLKTRSAPRPAPVIDMTNSMLASFARATGIEHALTLWPEWVWAIANLDKRVENRGWPLPANMIGRRIAIHAGASIGGRKGAPATDEGLQAVAGMATVAGWTVTIDRTGALFFSNGPTFKVQRLADITLSAIVCTAVLASCTEPSPVHSDDGWYVGEYGFRLSDVQVLPEPIHCSGAQGFWRIAA